MKNKSYKKSKTSIKYKHRQMPIIGYFSISFEIFTIVNIKGKNNLLRTYN